FGESQEDTGLAFLDLTYTHSNKIFHLLVNEGLVKDDSSSQTLSSFLEVVSFVHCWIEMEVERRVPRQVFEGLSRVLSNTKTSWGSFFARPPEEPRLENESVESVCGLMTRRCDQYHASYVSSLQTDGRLHALRTCCAAFLENVLPGYLSQREGSGKDEKRTNNLDEAILHYIGEFVYDLERDIHFILAQRTL
ncbi:MAG: hypothetical protein JRJ47_11730, partial [Deltaproteobacteria bacterium]|nr:hypothetical protein [Deltaproteobacteria bacterium]